jgi:hypothetical protein
VRYCAAPLVFPSPSSSLFLLYHYRYRPHYRYLYRGCVQASPPHTENTVTQCIKLAMKAAAERPNFRGVLLVPARSTDLLLAQQDIHTTTLTVFPNNSIPSPFPSLGFSPYISPLPLGNWGGRYMEIKEGEPGGVPPAIERWLSCQLLARVSGERSRGGRIVRKRLELGGEGGCVLPLLRCGVPLT